LHLELGIWKRLPEQEIGTPIFAPVSSATKLSGALYLVKNLGKSAASTISGKRKCRATLTATFLLHISMLGEEYEIGR
jgi:hypothetical protein